MRQDPDIFDTWFSSGLWPFSTLGWPEATDDLARYYPGSVMETGYDIIFFWVARMAMLGLALLDEPPFETVYLSGLIRDPYGKKMSKTTGNVVDPLGIIDATGADALRFSLIHGATPGLDQRFGEAKVENARNFANKLWNATRFVLGSRPASVPAGAGRRQPDPAHLGPAERWIRSRRASTVDAVDRAMADLQFAEVTRALYDAIWSEYCDWGLELAKVRLADASLADAEREATWWTLVEALDTYLRLLHPVMPFVTEELWGALPHTADDPDLLIVADWPEGGERDSVAEAELDAVVAFIAAVRNARAEAGVPAASWLPMRVALPAALGDTFAGLQPAIERMTRSRPLVVVSRSDFEVAAPDGLVVIAGDLEARIANGEGGPLSERDSARLDKELSEAEAFLAKALERLANPTFVERAPADIIEGARQRAAELADTVSRLKARVER